MTEPELRDAFVDGLVTREEYIRRSGGTSEWLRNNELPDDEEIEDE